VAPTIEMRMGIKPAGQNGVPLADALQSPPIWEAQAQQKSEPRLLGDVLGLEQEASLRPNLKKTH